MSDPGPHAPASTASPLDPAAVLHIDCASCVLEHSTACSDCVVTFLFDLEAQTPVVIDLAEARAMRVLGEAGLAPPLRHRRALG